MYLSTLPIRNTPPQWEARLTLAVVAILAIGGIALGWNGGQLPQPLERSLDNPTSLPTISDMQLYRQIVADVHAGSGYYAAANARLSEHSFPRTSPFNWRLPTYAWLWGMLPSAAWIRIALVLLSLFALGLAYHAQWRALSPRSAAVGTLLLVGVVGWSLDGDAFLTQEVWAATLILVSFSALALRWDGLAIAAGLAALLFRELALPYCLIAGCVMAWQRRWWAAFGWGAGLALFFAFLAWHIGQVRAQLAASDVSGTASLAQWLQFGGLDFVLLTARMNALVYHAPAAVLWLYLLGSLLGLVRGKEAASLVAGLTVAAYLAAFAIIGRPWNFYWGLLYAPLLPWGLVQLPAVLKHLAVQARGLPSAFPAPGLQRGE
jgi:hypothetical protein